MSDKRNNHRLDLPDYECIDPSLGEQMWRLADPECPAELQGQLQTHQAYCSHCRLQGAFEDKVVGGLGSKRLRLSKVPPRIISFPEPAGAWGAGLGAVALAAGFALLMLLPPRTTLDGRIMRGDETQAAILRPVADEVTLGGHPRLRWTPLEGATRYEVRIEQVGGGYAFRTATTETELSVPEGMQLPVGERYRLVVEPVPRHAAPEGGLRSSFATGGIGRWLEYRLRRGSRGGLALGGLGVILLGASLFLGRPRH